MRSNVFFPRWSHQGDKVAFLVRHTSSEQNSIQLVDINTKVVSVINVDGLHSFGMPTWMQNDEAILVKAEGENGTNFYSININDGSFQKQVNGSGGYAIHTKDDEIWYSKNDTSIYKISLKSPDSMAEKVLSSGEIFNTLTWVKADLGIYFLKKHADHQTINFYDTSNETVKTLVKVPLRTIDDATALSVMVEKKRLIFTQTSFPQVNIKRLSHPLLSD